MTKATELICSDFSAQVYVKETPDGFEARQAVAILGGYKMSVPQLQRIQYNPFHPEFDDFFVKGKGATKEAAVEALRVAVKTLSEMDEERRVYVHEMNLFRQWFDSVQDLNPKRLLAEDYVLAAKLYERLGMRVPNSIADNLPK